MPLYLGMGFWTETKLIFAGGPPTLVQFVDWVGYKLVKWGVVHVFLAVFVCVCGWGWFKLLSLYLGLPFGASFQYISSSLSKKKKKR